MTALRDFPTPEFYAGQDLEYHALKGCPDCKGRGWLFIGNPYAEFNRGRFRLCPTCVDALRHFDKHGTLPADIEAAITRSV